MRRRWLSSMPLSLRSAMAIIPGHNNAKGVGGDPRIVRGPGEYEISDVLITGVASYHDDKHGKEYGRNTIYIIHIDEFDYLSPGRSGGIRYTKSSSKRSLMPIFSLFLLVEGVPSMRLKLLKLSVR